MPTKERATEACLGWRWGRDLPGGPVVKNLPSNAGGSTSIPVGELRAPQLPSLRASTRERPTLCDKEPKHRKQRPCVPQRTPTQPEQYKRPNEVLFQTSRIKTSLFILGCAGSLLLCVGLLQLRRVGATLPGGVTASHCSGLSRGAQAPGVWASVVAAHRLSCFMACGIFLDLGSNPCPLH